MILLIRKTLLNATVNGRVKYKDRFEDDFKTCFECSINANASLDWNRTRNGQDDQSETTTLDPAAETSVGFVPLEGKQCTRQICRRRFFGTKSPPVIKQVAESCQDAKSRYVHELKEKLKLRKLCWETMFGQVSHYIGHQRVVVFDHDYFQSPGTGQADRHGHCVHFDGYFDWRFPPKFYSKSV
jgi:hypothetical protein